MRTVRVGSQADEIRFCEMPAAVGPLAPTASNADEHWMVVDTDSSVRARASLWWRSTPPYGNHRVGLVGHYAAQDDEAAELLLETVCERLAALGCTIAIGPMDGST